MVNNIIRFVIKIRNKFLNLIDLLSMSGANV